MTRYHRCVPRHAQIIDDLVSAARPALADLVVTATLRGISAEQLAIVLERSFKGKVSFRFGLRTELITVAADRRLLATARNSIAKALLQREPDVPVVVLIEMEGYLAGGVRHLPTRLPS